MKKSVKKIPNLSKIFNRFNKKYFYGEIPTLELEWSNLIRITAAQCHFALDDFGPPKKYKPIKIIFSKKFFEEYSFDKDILDNIMLHEMCHAYCGIKFNYIYHGLYFQKMMELITGNKENHTYHKYNVDNLRNKKRTIIKMYCKQCKEYLGTKNQMPPKNKIKLGYKHIGCGGIVKFKKIKLGE